MANAKMSDVAKMAGVSLTTVGRALHGGYISEDKREKINKAIEELGYVPNKMASSLKNDSTKMLGHLMRFNPNMLYAKIADGINKAAAEKGYSVFPLTVYDENFAVAIDEFISRKVDGVIITSVDNIDEALISKLQKCSIPVVMIERVLDLENVDQIVINDLGGAYTAVSKIINTGRKNIAFVGSKPYKKSVELERKEGYLKALSEKGIAVNDSLIFEGDFYSCQMGYEGAKTIFENGEKPHAFFCTSDILAAGVMQYLYEIGLNIPNDVVVTGYDDTLATMLSPKISSVALDTEKIGTTAISLVLNRIINENALKAVVRIDTIFVERN